MVFADSCRHIFFFGTPHLGADLATWGNMVSDIVAALSSTYGEVLRGLFPDSETLDNISRRFNAVLNEPIPVSEKIHVCSFQEGQGMGKVKGTGSKVRLPLASTTWTARISSLTTPRSFQIPCQCSIAPISREGSSFSMVTT